MGTKVDMKKYLLSKKSYHQYELALIEEQLATPTAAQPEQDEDEVADQPANRGAAKQAAARTTAKPKAKPQVEEVEAEAEDDGLDFLDESEEEASAPTEDDVKVAVKKFVAAFGKEKVVGLLAKYKAKAIQDIKAKDYEAFINLVNTALAKHKK